MLINQAIHTLDLLQWFGGEVVSIQGSVTADALGDVIEVEDTAHASLRLRTASAGCFTPPMRIWPTLRLNWSWCLKAARCISGAIAFI
ncbi:hypothetical protein HMSSN139_02080 [Paenibacillus sp. HMSSN-139]|nr:hypothetical protein HMSSN139_02080 [Paenibacillus sp. HMSSN-139]